MTQHLLSPTEACWITLEGIVQDSLLQTIGTGLFSIPLWLIIRQNQLSIEGLVRPLPEPLP